MKKNTQRTSVEIGPSQMSSREAAETAIILSKEEGVSWDQSSQTPTCRPTEDVADPVTSTPAKQRGKARFKG